MTRPFARALLPARTGQPGPAFAFTLKTHPDRGIGAFLSVRRQTPNRDQNVGRSGATSIRPRSPDR
jgi:hypothetical protein